MFKRRTFVFAAILTLVMIMGAVGCTPEELQALQGTVKNVDSVSGNVTVTLKDGTTQTFNFADVTVDTIKEAAGNATIEIGDNVTIKVRKQGDVKEVDVEYAEVHGIIKSLGTANVTITTARKGDITLKVTSETKIRIEDKGTAAFSDLKSGQEVEVKYDVATKNALRINVNTDEVDNEGEIEGTVKAVDTTNNTVTITVRGNGDITLKVISSTMIRIEDKRTAALSDIKVGQKIQARYDKSNMNALKLAIENSDGDSKDNEDRD